MDTQITSTPKKEKPKHLGRGLQSLIGPITFDAAIEKQIAAGGGIEHKLPLDKELRDSLRDIDIELIIANPYQPRTVWDEKALAELADSIRAKGIIQPIIVRPRDGKYEIVAGERRFRASKIAGLKAIPAMLRRTTDEEMLELALIENIQRSDLNPIDRAMAYRNYLNSFSLTQTEASERLGENRSVVANYLRLLDLPEDVQQMLTDGSLSMGHARAILGLGNNDLQKKIANRAMAGRLSVREVERLVRKSVTGSVESKRKAKDKSAHIADMEARMRNVLGTKVNIETSKSGKYGRITIEFYSLEEFERIAEKMGVSFLEEV